jgi:rsbT co-antagonist protein RsbR
VGCQPDPQWSVGSRNIDQRLAKAKPERTQEASTEEGKSMASEGNSALPSLLRRHEQAILAEWLQRQAEEEPSSVTGGEVRQQSAEFLSALSRAVQSGFQETVGPDWDDVRGVLGQVSRSRARSGESPSRTARFIFSLKQPLFVVLRQELGGDGAALAQEVWNVTKLLDNLGLYITEVYERSRNEVIRSQQQEMLELSTPVVRLWNGILALPLIGTLDSARTQIVMESLLQKIVETGASIAIIDITGVPTVDTLVAQHLLKTVAAARLMGADCIISGIRPQIAQTIVHLGVDLSEVETKATLADAFHLALGRQGLAVAPVEA